MFTRTEKTWTQQGAKLTAKSGEENEQGEFGVSVALSAEGNTALIGGSAKRSASPHTGGCVGVHALG